MPRRPQSRFPSIPTGRWRRSTACRGPRYRRRGALNATEVERLEEFFDSLNCKQAPLLLLDYDGTLADFRINRFNAWPWAGVRELLTRVQKDNRTRLTVITGRPAGEINPLLQLETPVEVWGLHGAERLYVDGRRELEEAPPEALARLDELREQLRRNAFGGLFEDKPNAVVMHWRGHSPRQAQSIEQKTRALFEPAAQVTGLSLLPFESGIELRVGRDKGGAVQAIVEQAEFDAPVAYLGDDLTDESAFSAVNRVTQSAPQRARSASVARNRSASLADAAGRTAMVSARMAASRQRAATRPASVDNTEASFRPGRPAGLQLLAPACSTPDFLTAVPVSGHDFSRAVNAINARALAPEGSAHSAAQCTMNSAEFRLVVIM